MLYGGAFILRVKYPTVQIYNTYNSIVSEKLQLTVNYVTVTLRLLGYD